MGVDKRLLPFFFVRKRMNKKDDKYRFELSD